MSNITDTSLQKLTTAQEYIQFYYEKLKKELNLRGLQVSKVGLVGFILHILGFTQKDIKQYYDTLFREAFLGTSDLDENLSMHGSIWGYKTALSSSSSIVGNFEIMINAIPRVGPNIKRTITLENIIISINGMEYQLESKYVITGTSNCQITDTSGKVLNLPLEMNHPTIPIIDMKQYSKEEYTFSAPYYLYASYYIIEIEPDKHGYISDIQVFVKEADKEEYIEYETRLVDYYTNYNEEVVFVKYEDNKVIVQLGSGLHGKYVPNCSVKIKLKICSGLAGNISKQITIPQQGNLRIFDTNIITNKVVSSFTIPVGQLLKANIDYAEGGSDPLTGENLRLDIIGYIRSRNTMMSEFDFYYILKYYIPDFILMFKKSHVVDNIIYLFLPFLDQYQRPIKSQSISVKHPEFNPNSECFVYRPQFIINGKRYISPFLYVIDFMLRVYKGYLAFSEKSSYFTSYIDHILSNPSYKGPTRESIALSFYVKYDELTQSTRLLVQSYQNIDDYIMYITIPELGIHDICMNQYDSSSFEYIYVNSNSGNGLIFDTINITLIVYKDQVKEYTFLLENFSLISDVSDLLTLKTFEGDIDDEDRYQGNSSNNKNVEHMFPPKSWIINIPVMLLDEFDTNQDYYLQKFLNTFSLLSIEHQRLISDEIQIRFINTDFIPKETLEFSTKQKYNLDIYLPLILKINILGYKNKIIDSNINISEEEYGLKLKLAQILNDKYTGTKISFYKTQMIDIIHTVDWVKSCSVELWDSNKNHIQDSGDFELLSPIESIQTMKKLDAIKYCPLYPWWDVDNIEIYMEFE